MNKLSVIVLGVFLLALLSSQVVQAGITTAAPTSGNHSVTPTASVNATSKDKSGCERSAGVSVLLPLALAASLLHGWSQ
ncbi:hypothetical protein JOB18_025590 [Solea senegalensis]|uniref:Uncharacterized protein n=1 Tax=Solea senegalensis TaxID=28829 RepID=A0AAV6S2G9_SOLSE|nr:hypothetical protein JOB18_025590 [Solea senegalensis]